MNEPIIAALHTLKASWYELLLARMFGVKRVAQDSGGTVTMYYWRGKYYLTNWVDGEE
jgi:hypothetical protein